MWSWSWGPFRAAPAPGSPTRPSGAPRRTERGNTAAQSDPDLTQKVRQNRSITKTGSRHARRLLVEAAWHYRSRPRISRALADRHTNQPPQAIAISWSAQPRLHRTWTRLEARAKRRTIIATAAARELAGFCWAITQLE